jgi:thiamine biosynthesis lipoprotein
MTVSLHTGSRAATVSTEWTAWDTRFRLVVTDPWALRKARELVELQVGVVDEVVNPRRAGSAVRRLCRAGRAVPAPELLAELVGPGRVARIGVPRPFPYGLAVAPAGADLHQPAPPAWQQAFEATRHRRDGLRIEPGPTVRAWTAQRCAELVAEVTSCGALVAFGDDVATSGLAPVGGWRIELRDAPGEPSTVVAIDGGAISRLGTVSGRRQPRRLVVSSSGQTVLPAWRSVAVAAADAPAAATACTGAMLRGPEAPAWLAELGMPALLVDPAGGRHTVGGWPDPA